MFRQGSALELTSLVSTLLGQYLGCHLTTSSENKVMRLDRSPKQSWTPGLGSQMDGGLCVIAPRRRLR